MPRRRVCEALLGVGQPLAQRELAQSGVQQRLERMRQRAAEQFDGAGVEQLTQQRAAPVLPQRSELVKLATGFGLLANPELSQRIP